MKLYSKSWTRGIADHSKPRDLGPRPMAKANFVTGSLAR